MLPGVWPGTFGQQRGDIMNADFCKSIACPVRKVMNKRDEAGFINSERRQKILGEAICINCNAWKYD